MENPGRVCSRLWHWRKKFNAQIHRHLRERNGCFFYVPQVQEPVSGVLASATLEWYFLCSTDTAAILDSYHIADKSTGHWSCLEGREKLIRRLELVLPSTANVNRRKLTKSCTTEDSEKLNKIHFNLP